MVTVTPFPHSEILSTIFDFFRHRTPPMTARHATDVVRALSLVPREDPKTFAVRLRQEFTIRGYPLQHTHALNLTARLFGSGNWPQLSRTLEGLIVWSPDGLTVAAKDWDAAIDEVKRQCLARPASTGRELVIRVNARELSLTLRRHDADGELSEELLAAVSPASSNAHWWMGARSALEGLRRRLEEGRRYFIDGFTAARLCSREYPFVQPANPLLLTDAGNSELVLVQQDHPDEAYEMTEIARGDELECYAQLVRALDEKPLLAQEIEVTNDSWIIRGRRYRWALSTLRPQDFVPGLATYWFAEPEYSRLKHRYQLANEILEARPRRAARKPIEDLDSPRERYRINRHAMLRALNDQGLSWSSYCEKYGEEFSSELEATLPLWALIELAKRVPMTDPNIMFARPNRSELVWVEHDELLRALYLRIDHVTYRVPAGFDPALKETVREIIQEFSESLRAYQLIRAGVMQMGPDDMAHLAWIDDASQLFHRTREAGLVLFAGRIPRLFPVPKSNLPEGMSPFAFGHSLYLDFDREGA